MGYKPGNSLEHIEKSLVGFSFLCHLPIAHCTLGEKDVGLEAGDDGAWGTLPSWQLRMSLEPASFHLEIQQQIQSIESVFP